MPKKYHVTVKDTPWRFPPISEYSSIELEGCLGCLECVKRNSCIYDIYDKKGFDPQLIMDTGDSMCVNCFRCVQECKKGILTRARNPRYDEMGDDYWTPKLISSLWSQSATGQIPVSGAGYKGPFSGPGFDSMWTDMSEIVRPTRDGIHGREYISTVIELGRRPVALEFDEKGELKSELPRILELPIPIVFDIPPFGFIGQSTRDAMIDAAAKMQSLAVATVEEAKGPLAAHKSHLIVKFDPAKNDMAIIEGVPVVELAYSDDALKQLESIKAKYPDTIVSIRLPLDENAAGRAVTLTKDGAEVIHLQADYRGRGLGNKSDEFIVDLIREVHLAMVAESVRDMVTLLLTGGVAMAEHVAKIILCGVDGVGLDMPLLVALECRMCSECDQMVECPAKVDDVQVEWASQRIVNLLGSWHSQLIELMGAMGLREVRRLRGEVGRAMFFKDLEKECFAPIFGERKAS